MNTGTMPVTQDALTMIGTSIVLVKCFATGQRDQMVTDDFGTLVSTDLMLLAYFYSH